MAPRYKIHTRVKTKWRLNLFILLLLLFSIATIALSDWKQPIIQKNYKDIRRGLTLKTSSISKLWDYSTGRNLHSSPALGELNGDGLLDVVIGSYDNKTYALHGINGTEI